MERMAHRKTLRGCHQKEFESRKEAGSQTGENPGEFGGLEA